MIAPRIYSPDNPPAFPYAFEHEKEGGVNLGMSLRDWFAGQALAGQISNPAASLDACGSKGGAAIFARDSYVLADAMISARKEASK